MNPLSQFERLVERVLEDELPKRLGGRLDPTELTIAIDAALASASTPPTVVTVAVATTDYTRLAPSLPAIELELRRHAHTRIAEQWPAPRGPATTIVRVVADPTLAPRQVRVALADAVSFGAAPTRALTAVGSPQRMPAPVALTLERGAERIPVATLPFTLGRALDNDYVLDDSSVSRYHAELRAAGRRIVAHDVGSTNGVFLDGRRISA
ncbi:MAG: FHA domain-containing protein, partial [Dehalococcoidia bacterium]|nr:FHA domain-containing protein [Dehalococcoidia bacterium]